MTGGRLKIKKQNKEKNMLDKISQALNDLSGAERKVAECALSEPKWFVHAAVAESAERATVSQPTCPIGRIGQRRDAVCT